MKSGQAVIELIQHKVWMDRHDGLFDHIAMQVDDIAETSAMSKAKGILCILKMRRIPFMFYSVL